MENCKILMMPRFTGGAIGGPCETVTVCNTHGVEFTAPLGGFCPIGKLEERLEVLEQAHRRANLRFR